MTLSTAIEQLPTEGKGQQITFCPLILMEVRNLAVGVLGYDKDFFTVHWGT